MVVIHLTPLQLIAIGWIGGAGSLALALYWASDLKLAFRNHKHRREP